MSPLIARRLKAYCAATNTTESAVLEGAVAQFLAGTSEHTALFRRLDRLDRALKRSHRDSVLYGEALTELVRVWYAYTPELPDSAKPLAVQQSARRFEAFVRQLAARVGTGPSLIQELVVDDIADDAELDHARALKN